MKKTDCPSDLQSRAMELFESLKEHLEFSTCEMPRKKDLGLVKISTFPPRARPISQRPESSVQANKAQDSITIVPYYIVGFNRHRNTDLCERTRKRFVVCKRIDVEIER
jgi:hypothetical protein